MAAEKGPKLGSMHEVSLRASLTRFFAANPSEWLTIDDAELKFEGNRRSMQEAVRRMRRMGELGPGPDIRLPSAYPATPLAYPATGGQG